MTTMLDAALEYAARGFAVFPCTPGTKVPFEHSAGSKEATTDEKRIREWWTAVPTANVAIATGAASGLHVIDVDAPASDVMPRLPTTWIARTRAGGWHYFYRYPDGVASLPNTSKKAKPPLHPDCDTRGAGGYVLVFPSVVEDEETGVIGKYTWENDIEPAELPKWIVDFITPKVVQPQPKASFALISTSWADKALREEVDAVASMTEGGRNHRLNQAAFSLGQIVAGGHLSTAEVEGELFRAARACGLGERESHKTIRSGLRGGMQHPRSPRSELVRWKPDPFNGAEITIGDDLDVAPLPAPKPQPSPLEGDERRWALLNAVRDLGGLCDSWCAWVIRGADHPQPGLTIAGLLALGSVLSGRRLVYRRALSSLYVVSLASSAEGKNRPQSCLGRVIDECWPALAGPNSFSSGASFVDGVRRATEAGVGTALVLDEYGMQLAGMIGPRAASHRVDLKQSLTELATKGPDKWSPALSLVKGGGKLDLWAPSVSLLGSTTPESLHAVLTSTDVADGFVGRHLWMRSQSRLPMWQAPEDRPEDGIPPEVRGALAGIRARYEAWHMGLTTHETSGLDQLRLYDPIHVTDTPTARELLLAHKLACDEDRREGRRMEIPRATLGRMPELASRMALALAVLSQPEHEVPTVTELEVKVAIALAEESAAVFADSFASNRRPSWDDPAAQVELVVSTIRMAGGVATKSEILRGCRRLTATQVNEALARLVDEERGVVEKKATSGRPLVTFRLSE